ncbi:MAG: prolyl oligopeptidase family serine peptidase [Bacteroidota bacterium]
MAFLKTHNSWLKSNSLLVGLLLLTLICRAQKPALTFADLDKEWPAALPPVISNDGKYVSYNRDLNTIIKSTGSDWYLLLKGVKSCSFTQDSKRFLFLRNDSLYVGTPGKTRLQHIANATKFRLINRERDKDWLIYRKTDSTTVVIKPMQGGLESVFQKVLDYQVSQNSKTVILQIAGEKSSSVRLIWLDLKTGARKSIWSGIGPQAITITDDGDSMAFLSKNKEHADLWYFETGYQVALKLNEAQFDPGITITNIKAVNSHDHRVFFDYVRTNRTIEKSKNPNINIWSYNDPKLQPQQIYEANKQSECTACIEVNNKKIIDFGDAVIVSPLCSSSAAQDFILIDQKRVGNIDEWNWNPASKNSVQVVSLDDGSKRYSDSTIQSSVGFNDDKSYFLSPQQVYVIYFDPHSQNWYSYDIKSKTKTNLTGGVETTWMSYDQDDEPASDYYTTGVAGFTAKDSNVLLYDQNDIFQIDLSGKKPPINITNGYGKKRNIVFELVENVNQGTLKDGQKVLLKALNRSTFDEGYYTAIIGREKDPVLLTMQPCHLGIITTPYKNAYLLQRQDASQSPNWYFTTDFKNFEQLTNVQSERAYNWLTSELVNFTSLDGKSAHGVLYKPENFDSTKKYPVIFHYYERKVSEIHQFQRPRVFGSEMNIPYFVSNGYLVFTPDIHYQVGYPGKSAFNTIMGAANYLIKQPWVDSTKMGLQGHSFGGFETLYLITHTGRFAAAMASSPMSDFISAYGSVSIKSGDSRQRQYELYRDRIGGTLWDKPDLYIENSPVLKADQVTTPLLMMANDKDSDVPFQQGVEFFTAMRRLRKKAWMIQYDGADHWAFGENAKDFTIRVKQFFDYYLKGAPPPHWMTDGIPATMKGIDDGYAADSSGKIP